MRQAAGLVQQSSAQRELIPACEPTPQLVLKKQESLCSELKQRQMQPWLTPSPDWLVLLTRQRWRSRLVQSIQA